MKEITSTGQTVEEAVKKALEKLNVAEDDVEIQVIDEGKKGFFGIFGQKPATVYVKVKAKINFEADVSVEKDKTGSSAESKKENSDPVEEAEKFLEKVIKEMGIVNSAIDVRKEGKTIYFDIKGENLAVLIGKRGQTLNSLQYLTQLVANKSSEEYVKIILDAENYRERRNETLKQLAVKLADKAVKTNKEISLEPMPSFERKVIHSALMEDGRVQTYSIGTEPYRYIVIAPK